MENQIRESSIRLVAKSGSTLEHDLWNEKESWNFKSPDEIAGEFVERLRNFLEGETIIAYFETFTRIDYSRTNNPEVRNGLEKVRIFNNKRARLNWFGKEYETLVHRMGTHYNGRLPTLGRLFRKIAQEGLNLEKDSPTFHICARPIYGNGKIVLHPFSVVKRLTYHEEPKSHKRYIIYASCTYSSIMGKDPHAKHKIPKSTG